MLKRTATHHKMIKTCITSLGIVLKCLSVQWGTEPQTHSAYSTEWKSSAILVTLMEWLTDARQPWLGLQRTLVALASYKSVATSVIVMLCWLLPWHGAIRKFLPFQSLKAEGNREQDCASSVHPSSFVSLLLGHSLPDTIHINLQIVCLPVTVSLKFISQFLKPLW